MDDKSLLSIIYHDIFDFPLTQAELIKWETGSKFEIRNLKFEIENKRGYFFLKGRENLISKRLIRRRGAKRKMEIARKAARVLGLIPTIKLVGVTGALAMENAREESDIDFLIITSSDSLWLTRLLVFIVLKLTGFKLRRYGDKNEKDKLCLNMWLEDNDLVWLKKDRNIYSAHELGQLLPLVNKKDAYEYFLAKNKWVKDYWPNAVIVHRTYNLPAGRHGIVLRFFNKLAFRIQKQHMQGKITREIVTEHKAIFHPVNRTRKVFLALQKRGGT